MPCYEGAVKMGLWSAYISAFLNLVYFPHLKKGIPFNASYIPNKSES
jgi:hypothetical protein